MNGEMNILGYGGIFKMRLVISIPVHESPLCVLNQIDSIAQFVPSCVGIVLHISGDSDDNFYQYLLQASENKYKGLLYINSNRHHTHKAGESGNVTGLSTVWCDNFRYMSKIMDFDFYSMATSNELWVRSGIEDLIAKYKCMYDIRNPPSVSNRIPHANTAWEKVLKKVVNCEYPEFGVCEGSFFSFEVFKKISDLVLDVLSKEKDYMEGRPVVGVNEYILPTLIFTLFPELYNSIVPETYVFGPKDYNPNAPYIPESLVMAVKNGQYPNRFVVKRVPRDINHPIRKYINEMNGKEKNG